MARIIAWCDHPHAPTGFGRSANHVLYRLHEAGHELHQLAVNADPAGEAPPWRVYMPSNRAQDPYGLRDLPGILARGRWDLLWTTFDPEVPWKYKLPDGRSALDAFLQLRRENPGFRMLGWFPVDGGPLSDWELAILGSTTPRWFDVSVTMASHVHDLVGWSLRLRGHQPNLDAIRQALPVIPHGVDLDLYRIPTAEEKAAAKRAMGLDPARFVILQLERNQQRKQNWLALEVMERLLKAYPDLHGKVLLYQHMVQDEENAGCGLGFNLPELAKRYAKPDQSHLVPGQDVLWPGGFVEEKVLREVVYRAADAFLSVSTGEGFQYPAWEALACGIPLVVPDADARRAWFKSAPNVFRYRADRELVMRGGYNRRMCLPDPGEAARILAKLARGKAVKGERPAPEGGRAFVSRTADVRSVTAAWMDLVQQQLDDLAQERGSLNRVDYLVTDGQNLDCTLLDCSPGFGLGDTVLAAPALAAVLRGDAVHSPAWHLPKANRDLAAWLNVAEVLEEPMGTACRHVKLHTAYHPEPSEAWLTQDRTEFIAEALGVLPQLEKFSRLPAPEEKARFEATFRERFGVDPMECVVIAGEAANMHRSLTRNTALDLAARVRALGATPVLVGRQRLGVQHVGTLDLTGQTDLVTLRQLMGSAGAVVAVDSAPLYLALVQDTPVVGVFSCVDPATRHRWVGHGPREFVTPPAGLTLGGQQFPPGPRPEAAPGAWADAIDLDEVEAALRNLLGYEQSAPTITVPEGALDQE